jgi:predicted amidohydrolase
MSETLIAAVIQLNSQEIVERNLSRARELAGAAAARGAKLLVLPENFAFMGPESDKRRLAETIGDAAAPIQRALADIARSTETVVVAGGMPTKAADPARPYNTTLVVDADGAVSASYHKLHLFDVDVDDGASYRESRATTAGDEVVVTNVLGFAVGLSICYDLRFPELYRRMAAEGAECFVVPSAFTLTTGRDHWHPLLRARAIESQCYVLAAAQWGRHPGERVTFGHALIADPWGTVVAECPDGEGFALAELDRARLSCVRRALPCRDHRRF